MTTKYTEDHEWLKIDGDVATVTSPTTHKMRWAMWCLLTCHLLAARWHKKKSRA